MWMGWGLCNGVEELQLQMERMIKFDSGELPWEAGSSMVVPSSGERLDAAKLTNMLRGGGHIGPSCSVKTLEKVALALQGVASQTFKLLVTCVHELLFSFVVCLR
jgi:hypothetical protein